MMSYRDGRPEDAASLPSEADTQEEPGARWHCVFHDGDEPDLDANVTCGRRRHFVSQLSNHHAEQHDFYYCINCLQEFGEGATCVPFHDQLSCGLFRCVTTSCQNYGEIRHSCVDHGRTNSPYAIWRYLHILAGIEPEAENLTRRRHDEIPRGSVFRPPLVNAPSSTISNGPSNAEFSPRSEESVPVSQMGVIKLDPYSHDRDHRIHDSADRFSSATPLGGPRYLGPEAVYRQNPQSWMSQGASAPHTLQNLPPKLSSGHVPAFQNVNVDIQHASTNSPALDQRTRSSSKRTRTQSQTPILNDALAYLDQVKIQYSDRPDIYNSFLDIMKDYKSGAILALGVIGKLCTLFGNSFDLLEGFNVFLPSGYNIAYEQKKGTDTISITTPLGAKLESNGHDQSMDYSQDRKTFPLWRPNGTESESIPMPPPTPEAEAPGLQLLSDLASRPSIAVPARRVQQALQATNGMTSRISFDNPQSHMQSQANYPVTPIPVELSPRTARALDDGSEAKSPKRRRSTKRAQSNSNKPPRAHANRAFPCPFATYGCTSSFSSKNEWKRHVNIQHIRLGYWRCDLCKGDKPNDFNRKDLFIQHVRRMHPSEATGFGKAKSGVAKPTDAEDQALKAAAARCFRHIRSPPEQCTCLLCDAEFNGAGGWDERQEHLGRHMEAMVKEGRAIEPQNWKRDAALEDWLAQQELIIQSENGWVLSDLEQHKHG